MEREKILNGLRCHSGCERGFDCDNCDYIGNGDCFELLARDALNLLKEQEAVEPILEQDSMVCGVCGHEVIWQKMLGDGIWADEELDYCPHCGKRVKWE